MNSIYTKNTYNIIASKFDKTRYKQWKCVEKFIKTLSKESKILEAGCGNGKNLDYMIENDYKNVFGCDISDEFVKICKLKKLNVIESDITNLSYNDNEFDYCMAIAVIHHLSDGILRKKAIDELIRITRPNGKIFITVSSFEEPFYEKFSQEQDQYKNQDQDHMIPWRDKITREILVLRYYHLFKKNELEKLCDNEKISSIDSFYEEKNWCIIIKIKN